MRKLLLAIAVAITGCVVFVDGKWRGIDVSLSSQASVIGGYDDYEVIEHLTEIVIDTVEFDGSRSSEDEESEDDESDGFWCLLEAERGDGLEGIRRFERKYRGTLGHGADKADSQVCIGYLSFSADYADTSIRNAGMINRFVCSMADVFENENVDIPVHSPYYEGYDPTHYFKPVFGGNVDNMPEFAYFVANKTFENWKRGDDLYGTPNGADIQIRIHIVNDRYVTFSKSKQDIIGIGHGMYTETFHTMDLASGERLTNSDIFRPGSLDKVKMLLFEVMASDRRFSNSRGVKSAAEVGSMLDDWEDQGAFLKGKEGEGAENESGFHLPEGALTDSGVVFSFQPYEIDCFAAGAYHFIVPYERLKPYISEKIKSYL